MQIKNPIRRYILRSRRHPDLEGDRKSIPAGVARWHAAGPGAGGGRRVMTTASDAIVLPTVREQRPCVEARVEVTARPSE